jgi:apolipoprotein N-acyltransferase
MNNSAARLSACFALGGFCVLGYAPFHFYPATILSLAGLFYFWQNAATPKQAAWLGYAFGLGIFNVGVSWIYVSLHDYGGMPLPAAAFCTFAFCAFLALFPAVAGWLSKQKRLATNSLLILSAAPIWVLIEWVRSWIFTGFPWLNVGYSQIPNSPLAAFAPVVGIYGVSLIVVLIAVCLAQWHRKPLRKKILAALAIIWIAGSLLKLHDWTQPMGEPVSVALLQGNIPQDMKWRPQVAEQTLDSYLEMAGKTNARLIIMPETALPVLKDQLSPAYIDELKAHAIRNGGDVLVGVVESENNQYYNSVLSYGSAATQAYRKSHLVPFGEFIPLKPIINWIYRDLLDMPLSDLSRGSIHQKPLAVAGQRVAVNICYEDAFGEEIIRQLPEATMLVNASNMAWYGNSWSADQHLQMSQTRALETGRMMLRATNTGATAIINTKGHILSYAPQFTETTLEGTAHGYIGSTPYVRLGNWPVIVLCFGLLALLWVRKKK